MPIFRMRHQRTDHCLHPLLLGISLKVCPLDYSYARNLEFKAKKNTTVMIIIANIYRMLAACHKLFQAHYNSSSQQSP